MSRFTVVGLGLMCVTAVPLAAQRRTGPGGDHAEETVISTEAGACRVLAYWAEEAAVRPNPAGRPSSALDAMSPETRSEYLASHPQVAQGQGMPESIFKKAMAYERSGTIRPS